VVFGPGGSGDSLRRDDVYEESTDPEAKQFRKGDGKPSQLCYVGRVLMENRSGLRTDALVSQADGRAEPEAVLAMVRRSIEASHRRVTLGPDRGYDVGEFQVALAEETASSLTSRRRKGSRLSRIAARWVAVDTS